MSKRQGSQGEGMEERIRVALLAEPSTLERLAQELGVSQTELMPEIERLVEAQKIANVAQPESPIWTWRIGPQCSDAELVSAVTVILRYIPKSIPVLAAALGVNERRAANAFTAVRQGPEKEYVVNYGNDESPLWFILPHDRDQE